MTVTLGAPKLPLVLPPGEGHCGDVVIADIGIPEAAIEAVEGPHLELLTRDVVRALIEPRPADSHKGDYGHVLVVAGGRGKTGAAHLAAMGALQVRRRARDDRDAAIVPADRGGDGAGVHDRGAGRGAGRRTAARGARRVLASQADVIAVGPGLGHGAEHGRVRARAAGSAPACRWCSTPTRSTPSPTRPSCLVGREGRDVIITPHPGELARLVGVTTADVQANRIEIAQDFAETHQLYVVLKGHRTIIATPDGSVFVNPTGNAGHGDRRHGRRADGMVAAWLGAAARRRGGVQARGLSARRGRRSRRSRPKAKWRSTPSDVARAARRRGARADRATEARRERGRRDVERDRGPTSADGVRRHLDHRARTTMPPAGDAGRDSSIAGDVVLLSRRSRRGQDRVRARPGGRTRRDPDDVSSPTFTLVHEYRGGRDAAARRSVPAEPAEVDDLGLERSADEGVFRRSSGRSGWRVPTPRRRGPRSRTPRRATDRDRLVDAEIARSLVAHTLPSRLTLRALSTLLHR